MKESRVYSRPATLILGAILIGLACVAIPMVARALSPVPTGKPSEYPDWWFERDVVKRTGEPPDATPEWPDDYRSSDDYAVLNTGQLKNLASKAAEELEKNLPGGAGSDLKSLVDGWLESPATPNNLVAANLGQLKNVTRLLYDRLIEEGFAGDYPWASSMEDPDDYAVANLGQAKNLFSFELTTDTEGGIGDGLPDWWETLHFSNLLEMASGDGDSDGFTNIEEYRLGLDPNEAPLPDSQTYVELEIFTPVE